MKEGGLSECDKTSLYASCDLSNYPLAVKLKILLIRVKLKML